MSVWRPVPRFPINLPVTPDAKVYWVALGLAVLSGLIFGAVPVSQVLRTDPYGVAKPGLTSARGRRLNARDLLLVTQIAICALLVTASMVALRGLVRTLHSSFGFEPRNAIVMDTSLDMAGYRGPTIAVMQKRMIDAVSAIPGVKAVGMVDWLPLGNGDFHSSLVFSDEITDLRPSNALTESVDYAISPGYLQAANTRLVEGRAFTWEDDEKSPRVAIVNRFFARTIFGSEKKAMGGHYKLRDGTRLEVVGIVEDGKYQTLTEDQRVAMFVPILQDPSGETSIVVRSERDPAQLAVALQAAMRRLDSGLPLLIETWNQKMDLSLFAPRVATIALGLLGAMGALLSVTGIFGMAAYSVSKRLRELGIRIALGAQRKEVLEAALGRPFKLLVMGSAAGLLLGILAARVLAYIVYQATPRDPLVLIGVVVAMTAVGLVATWIPAQRALSIDPLILMREE
jgi:predicted permease